LLSFSSFLVVLLLHAAPTQTSTLSLHDALPISASHRAGQRRASERYPLALALADPFPLSKAIARGPLWMTRPPHLLADKAEHCRSEEHTSELQSRFDLVCRLLLEKKKHTKNTLS